MRDYCDEYCDNPHCEGECYAPVDHHCSDCDHEWSVHPDEDDGICPECGTDVSGYTEFQRPGQWD